jgi:predicted nuclease of restriction endonuclease-like (RecB) superfamily
MSKILKLNTDSLIAELKDLINQTRNRVATTVNSELTMLYWHIGLRIRTEVLKNERAEYGEQIVATVSRQLTEEFGKGFDTKNIFRMIQFAELFPDIEIVVTLSRQLSWSHFLAIFPVKNDLARDFYAEMCRFERWSVRTLRKKIDSMLFERTAISKKPEETIKNDLELLRDEDKLTPDLVFRNPYFLDFLGLADTYSEKDLEDAILRELERFLLELGTHFTFVARQKRIVIDGEDFKIDLLLFHRVLQRLIAIELKIGKFKAEYKGKIELYLRWLDKHERLPHESEPLGLILCTEAGAEQVELLELTKSGIRIGKYLTELPPRELLEHKLLEAISLAKNLTDKHK